MPFIPHTDADVKAMLAAIGVASIDQLFEEIPERLRAGKLKAEVGFDSAGRYKLKGIYGYYLLDEARNGNDAFGQEFDLVFNWQYNAAGNAMISLMGAIFLPDDGYKAVAPVQPAGDDVIFLGAANLQVSF